MRIFSIVFALLFSCFSFANSVDMNDPNQVIRTVSTTTLARISAEKVRLEKEPGYINTVIEEELIPYFDYKYAAYMVMGPNLQKTSIEQRDHFVEAFKTYLVNAYGHILFEYDNHKLEILDDLQFKNKKITSVDVRVRDANNQLTQLSFKLRKNSKTEEWKVFDVIAEGISMLNTKKSELGELIKRDGIDHVIELLENKNSEFSS